MDAHAAFLEAICENPDDDGPRLMYADWLEERGDPRGEFIRVQCELAGLPEPRKVVRLCREVEINSADDGFLVAGVMSFSDAVELFPERPAPVPIGTLASDVAVVLRWDGYEAPLAVPERMQARGFNARVRFRLLPFFDGEQHIWFRTHDGTETREEMLRRRERELHPQGGREDVRIAMILNPAGNTFTGPLPWKWEYRRGFVEHVELSCADWLEHGAALVRAAPIRIVRLTDRTFEVDGDTVWNHWFRGSGDSLCSVPEPIFDLLSDGEFVPEGRNGDTGRLTYPPTRYYPSDPVRRGHADLSRACLLWAREQAGLPAPGSTPVHR